MADPNPATPAKSRMNRWLAIGLIASVALNLAFIGWGAVRFAGHREMVDRPGSHVEERIARRLPGDAARAFRQAMAGARKSNAVSFHELRDDIARALAAEPFDRARLEALLAEHRSRLDQFQQGMQAGLLAAAEVMTPEQRRQYAEKMLRRGPRHEREQR